MSEKKIANAQNVDEFVHSELHIENYKNADKAINGIQVDNHQTWQRLAVCVDFCEQTIDRAIAEQCQAMLVHHGIFWGAPFPIRGRYHRLLSKLIKADMALLAIHLPLDMDLRYGNNVGIIDALGMRFVRKFGDYRGIEALFLADFPNEKKCKWQEFLTLVQEKIGNPLLAISSSQQPLTSVAICSGGGLFGLEMAKDAGADALLTGDANHTFFHLAKELDIALISAGHYQTETFGVKRFGEKLAKIFDLETIFIDVPTGL